MAKLDRNAKVKKYIVLVREQIIKNLDGDDKRRMMSEMYIRKPNTQYSDGFVEYERCMSNSLNDKFGRNVGIEEGQSYVSYDGTVGAFIDINFSNNDVESNDVRAVRTYTNRKFLNRDRDTTFNEVIDYAVDSAGNVFQKEDEEN